MCSLLLLFYKLTFLALLVLSFSFTPFFSEQSLLTFRYARLNPQELHPNLKIVGLGPHYKGIDSITPKDSVARIIEQLHQAGAAVIAVNYIVKESHPGFKELEKVVKETPGLVFPETYEVRKREKGLYWGYEYILVDSVPDSFNDEVWKGYGNLDESEMWQMTPMSFSKQNREGTLLPSFSLAILGAYLISEGNSEDWTFDDWKSLVKKAEIPWESVDDFIQRRPIAFFDLYDSNQIIAAEHIKDYSGEFRDKIVLVGAYESAPKHTQNVFLTPYDYVNSVLVQAAIVNNHLNGSYIHALDSGFAWVIVVLSFLLGGGVFYTLNKNARSQKNC